MLGDMCMAGAKVPRARSMRFACRRWLEMSATSLGSQELECARMCMSSSTWVILPDNFSTVRVPCDSGNESRIVSVVLESGRRVAPLLTLGRSYSATELERFVT